MRPARKGPENQGEKRSTGGGELASMRPARKGPENRPARSPSGEEPRVASMRPARKGPENRTTGPPSPACCAARFNEAGPQGAGKPVGISKTAARKFMLQ